MAFPEAERGMILPERDAGVAPPVHGGVGYLGLIRTPTMWGLFISQGCLSLHCLSLYVLAAELFADGAAFVDDGVRHLYRDFVFRRCGGQHRGQLVRRPVDYAEAVRGGKRRYLVALCLLLTAVGLLIPLVPSLAGVIRAGYDRSVIRQCRDGRQWRVGQRLLRSPADAGRAFAFLVLGGNTFGLLAPIVTGYLVEWTKASFRPLSPLEFWR